MDLTGVPTWLDYGSARVYFAQPIQAAFPEGGPGETAFWHPKKCFPRKSNGFWDTMQKLAMVSHSPVRIEQVQVGYKSRKSIMHPMERKKLAGYMSRKSVMHPSEQEKPVGYTSRKSKLYPIERKTSPCLSRTVLCLSRIVLCLSCSAAPSRRGSSYILDMT